MNIVLSNRFGRIASFAFLFLGSSFGQVNVLQHAYNNSNTSANLSETQLNTGNVNTSTFGKLGKYTVDGVIYAMPLYVQGVSVNGVSHNVLYVATMHDVLYAFDADSVGSLPLWTLDFRNAAGGITPPPIHPGQGDGTDGSVADTFGIMSTPVIDLANNRMFCVTHTNESGTEYFRLRSVDIRTGALLEFDSDIRLSAGLGVGAWSFVCHQPLWPARRAATGRRPSVDSVWIASNR